MKNLVELITLLISMLSGIRHLPDEITTKLYRYYLSRIAKPLESGYTYVRLFIRMGRSLPSGTENVTKAQFRLPPGLAECPTGKTEKAQVFVGFATNRELKNKEFTNSLASSVAYGYCEVSIPKDHVPGQLEQPKQRWYWFDETVDQSKHFVLKQYSTVDASDFFEHIYASWPESVLLYVHGFNVSFEDSALRAAQLDYDLRFRGQTLFFSWASHGAASGYVNDGQRISHSVKDIREFLERLATNEGVDSIFMLAHSMGSRGLAEALSTIKRHLTPMTRAKFRELILTEPDISQDIFLSGIAGGLKALGARVTIYSSKNDRALGFSQAVNCGVPRLGQAGSQIFVDPRFDTVDASDVGISMLSLNHSSYAENLEFIWEIVGVMDGKKAKDRPGIDKVKGKSYWYLFPAKK